MVQPVLIATCLLWLLASGCSPGEEDLRRMIHDEIIRSQTRTVFDPVETVGPYSPAVRVGGYIFVSGQIGIDQETGIVVPGGIEAETRKTLENLMLVLRSAGYDSSHVVSTTVFLRSMEDYPLMNQIYGGYFEEKNYPARTTVSIVDLPRGASVEISAIAFKQTD
jgi:2-iminobutanoate/2-iminopropanoate deaminase